MLRLHSLLLRLRNGCLALCSRLPGSPLFPRKQDVASTPITRRARGLAC